VAAARGWTIGVDIYYLKTVFFFSPLAARRSITFLSVVGLLLRYLDTAVEVSHIPIMMVLKRTRFQRAEKAGFKKA